MKQVLRYTPPPTAEAADRPLEQRWTHCLFAYEEDQDLEPGVYGIYESVGKPGKDGLYRSFKLVGRPEVEAPEVSKPKVTERDEPHDL